MRSMQSCSISGLKKMTVRCIDVNGRIKKEISHFFVAEKKLMETIVGHKVPIFV